MGHSFTKINTFGFFFLISGVKKKVKSTPANQGTLNNLNITLSILCHPSLLLCWKMFSQNLNAELDLLAEYLPFGWCCSKHAPRSSDTYLYFDMYWQLTAVYAKIKTWSCVNEAKTYLLLIIKNTSLCRKMWGQEYRTVNGNTALKIFMNNISSL